MLPVAQSYILAKDCIHILLENDDMLDYVKSESAKLKCYHHTPSDSETCESMLESLITYYLYVWGNIQYEGKIQELFDVLKAHKDSKHILGLKTFMSDILETYINRSVEYPDVEYVGFKYKSLDDLVLCSKQLAAQFKEVFDEYPNFNDLKESIEFAQTDIQDWIDIYRCSYKNLLKDVHRKLLENHLKYVNNLSPKSKSMWLILDDKHIEKKKIDITKEDTEKHMKEVIKHWQTPIERNRYHEQVGRSYLYSVAHTYMLKVIDEIHSLQ